ncbi:MAG: hypothetical protein Q4B69_02915 [Slackia sp.]|nr:hypothetical protein [Slackia sp.]
METDKRKRAVALAWIAMAFMALGICSCAPTVAEENTQDDASSQDGTAFVWSSDSDCKVCHDDVVESFGDQACSASQHPDLENDCFSCHDDEQGLEKAHDGVMMGDKKKRSTLKETEVSQEACTECHSPEDVLEKTASSTALTDKNGLIVNPHDIPENEEHTNAAITCSTCHKLHSQDSVQQVAAESCLNCHHAGVYECNTCHLSK